MMNILTQVKSTEETNKDDVMSYTKYNILFV